LLNTVWATISLLIVLAALAVGRERQQLRNRARVRVDLPAIIHLYDGRVLTGRVQNLSQSGARATVVRPDDLPEDSEIVMEVPLPSGSALIPSRYLRWSEKEMLLNFEPKTLADEAAIIQTVFGRADAWLDWADYPTDQPLRSLWEVLVSIGGLFAPRNDGPPPTDAEKAQAEEAVKAGIARANAKLAGGTERGTIGPAAPRAARAARAAAILALMLVLPLSAAIAQTTTVRPLPPSMLPSAASGGGPSGPGIVPMPNIIVPPATPAPAAATVTPAATAAATPASTATADQSADSIEIDNLTLKQLGSNAQIALRGTSPLQGVEFGVRNDEVVTNSTLTVSGAMSPALIPDLSNITVTLNDQYVGTIPVNQGQPNFSVTLPVNPVFFQTTNHLNFRLTGAYTRNCNDLLSGLIWSTVYNTSTLTMTVQHLPPQRDLGQLPLPFFDSHDNNALLLPFVLPASPDNDTLKAAGIVASWFGQFADFRGASFPVSATPPRGNAVMIVTSSTPGSASMPGLPPIQGPGVAVIPNPSDPLGTILVISGRTGAEAAQAAAALALGSRSMGGSSLQVTAPVVPTRVPYDAPAWIASDRPVRVGELTDARNLTGVGYDNLVQVAFRTSPDLYTWRSRGFPLRVAFRAPPGPIENLAVSRLDIGINGLYLHSIPLANATANAWWRDWIPVFGPVGPYFTTYIPPYDVFGANALQFFFDTRPLDRGACGATPSDPQMGIDPTTTISLARGYHFAQMPNLAYFVSAGFPYTRLADLSHTTIIVPDSADTGEQSAYLRLMGRFGYLTGYPVLGVSVARPEEEANLQSGDLLVIGTLAHLGSLSDILKNVPISIDNGQLSVKMGDSVLGTVFRLFSNDRAQAETKAAAALSVATSQDTAIVTGGRSPWDGKSSVVALLAGTPQGLDGILSTFRDPTLNPLIQGDFSLISGGQVTSYRIGSTYTVGSLPFWILPSFWLGDQPATIVVLMIVGCVVLTLALHAALRRRARARLKALGEE